MTKDAMIQANEARALKNIQEANKKGDFVEAMRLCAEYMGLDAKTAYERTKMICGEAAQK